MDRIGEMSGGVRLLGPLTGRGGGGSGPPTPFEQMNAYAADGLFVSWLHLGDVTALFEQSTFNSNADHSDTIGGAVDRATRDTDFATWLAAQPELVTNGGFDTDSVWTKTANWEISGGTASSGVSGGEYDINQDVGYEDGANYFYGIEIVSVSATRYNDRFAFSFGDGDTQAHFMNSVGISATGPHTFVASAGSVDDNFRVFSEAFVAIQIDNVSIKKIDDPLWTQATAANRPLYNRISDGNGGFYAYITWDGTNDSLPSLITSDSLIAFYTVVRTTASRGTVVHDNATSGGANVLTWEDGSGSASWGGVAGTPTVSVFDPDTQTWAVAATRDALHTAIADGEWRVVRSRNTNISAWNAVTLNNRDISYVWAGDEGEFVAVLEEDHTDAMALVIANHMLEQVGAA